MIESLYLMSFNLEDVMEYFVGIYLIFAALFCVGAAIVLLMVSRTLKSERKEKKNQQEPYHVEVDCDTAEKLGGFILMQPSGVGFVIGAGPYGSGIYAYGLPCLPGDESFFVPCGVKGE